MATFIFQLFHPIVKIRKLLKLRYSLSFSSISRLFRFKNFTIPFSSLFHFLKIKIQLDCRINFHTTNLPLFIYIYIYYIILHY